MAKGRRSKIQRREACDIAKKLRAEITDGTKHERALIYENGALITSFGIRHNRTGGHGHIPRQLFVNETVALQLAKCTISREQYFDILNDAGRLP